MQKAVEACCQQLYKYEKTVYFPIQDNSGGTLLQMPASNNFNSKNGYVIRYTYILLLHNKNKISYYVGSKEKEVIFSWNNAAGLLITK